MVKNKAFTLIEIVIVISIIIIMAVLAVPAFDRYGARNELDGKAEEIKTFIETAYKQAQSPQKGVNGSSIMIKPLEIYEKVALYSGGRTCDYDGSYPGDPNACAGTAGSGSITSVYMGDGTALFSIGDITRVGTASIGGDKQSILFLSPVEEDNIYIMDNSSSPSIGSKDFKSISFVLSYSKTAETRNITINRYPFSVFITNP